MSPLLQNVSALTLLVGSEHWPRWWKIVTSCFLDTLAFAGADATDYLWQFSVPVIRCYHSHVTVAEMHCTALYSGTLRHVHTTSRLPTRQLPVGSLCWAEWSSEWVQITQHRQSWHGDGCRVAASVKWTATWWARCAWKQCFCTVIFGIVESDCFYLFFCVFIYVCMYLSSRRHWDWCAQKIIFPIFSGTHTGYVAPLRKGVGVAQVC